MGIWGKHPGAQLPKRSDRMSVFLHDTLSREKREFIESGFRNHDHPGDPNLLSCTPTLEMGIKIGDLSALALCSVPPKPRASQS